MPQDLRSFEETQKIIDEIEFPWRALKLINIDGHHGYLLQVYYYEPDINDPKGTPKLQKGRKFYVSPFMTESEVVETAFLAISRSMMHQTKEHFTYMRRRVRSPHFGIGAVIGLCDEDCFDSRMPLEAPAPIALPQEAKCYSESGECINSLICNMNDKCMSKPES